jgi:hypothetical protein
MPNYIPLVVYFAPQGTQDAYWFPFYFKIEDTYLIGKGYGTEPCPFDDYHFNMVRDHLPLDLEDSEGFDEMYCDGCLTNEDVDGIHSYILPEPFSHINDQFKCPVTNTFDPLVINAGLN